MPYYVYMLRCRDGSLYTGITPDPVRRMRAHRAGTGARYTRSHPPAALAALWRAADKNDAARLEYAVKRRLDKGQKEALAADPGRLASLLPSLAALDLEPVPGVTLEDCLEGAFHG
ncbi:MAG: GIY-YIG nuclease family protein [Ruminococcaceae bacterium]|nr:GIY-YIG nuclease family protein [Oscillospiraceae bacterium]